MVTKKDKAALQEMIHRLGVEDFLATVGNILHDKAMSSPSVDAGALALSKAAEKCWEASEQ